MVSEPPYPKRQSLLAAALLLALALAAMAFAMSELLPMLGAIERKEVIIAFWSTAMVGLPLTILFIAGSAMLVLSLRPGPESPTIRWCMIIAAIALILVPITPWASRTIMGSHLSDLGYKQCPTIFERPAKIRWTHQPAACPR